MQNNITSSIELNKYLATKIMGRTWVVWKPLEFPGEPSEPSLPNPNYTSRTSGDIWDLIRYACLYIHGEGCQLIFESSTPETIAEDIAIKHWQGSGNNKEDAPWNQ